MGYQSNQKNQCNCSASVQKSVKNKLDQSAAKIKSALITAVDACALKKTSKIGLREGWTRVTFILKEEHVDRLKALAYWERSTIKDIVDEALSMYLENSKKKIVMRDF